MCLALHSAAFGGQGKAVLAGRDDVQDEPLAVHTHLHGAPVFSQFLGKLDVLA